MCDISFFKHQVQTLKDQIKMAKKVNNGDNESLRVGHFSKSPMKEIKKVPNNAHPLLEELFVFVWGQ